MQKNQKIILQILVFFFLGSLAFFALYRGGAKPKTLHLDDTPSYATTTVRLFKTEVQAFATHTSQIDIDVEYPQIVQAATGTVEENVNTLLKKDAKQMYDASLVELKNAVVDIEGRSVTFERKINADKTYINTETGIVSFQYSNYTDTGGAHGTPFYGSDMIDMRSGKKLVLTDLLQGEYGNALVKEIDTQIRKSASTCLRCDALSGELENLDVKIPETFLLSDQGITFLFSAYELGSYAATAGGQEVFVDKDFLKPYIGRNW